MTSVINQVNQAKVEIPVNLLIPPQNNSGCTVKAQAETLKELGVAESLFN